MWIRSQNKRCLIEVNQVGETNGKIICNKWILGEYAAARAIEVLGEIESHINMNELTVFEMPEK